MINIQYKSFFKQILKFMQVMQIICAQHLMTTYYSRTVCDKSNNNKNTSKCSLFIGLPFLAVIIQNIIISFMSRKELIVFY